jgi:hypothetical protein
MTVLTRLDGIRATSDLGRSAQPKLITPLNPAELTATLLSRPTPSPMSATAAVESPAPLLLAPTFAPRLPRSTVGAVLRRLAGCYQGNLISRAKDAIRNAERRELGLRLFTHPGVTKAAELGLRLVGLAADEDPELGLLGCFHCER